MAGHQVYVGFGIMSRIRPTCSHQNLHTTWALEQPEQHKFATRPQRNKSVSSASPSAAPVSSPTYHSRQRNHSVSHTVPSTPTPPRKIQDARSNGHWPPLEFDPLKLNPTVIGAETTTEKAPPRLYERDLLRTTSLRTRKTSQVDAGYQPRRRPRLHHSDSGISFDYETYSNETQFNFAEEKAKALNVVERPATHEDHVHQKGWPSPSSSVDSGKSWFDMDDDDEDDNDDSASDDDELVTDESEPDREEKDVWTALQSPRRRPQVGSPDDPTNYLKRGAWKRRAIFFGQQSNEVYTKEDDAFDCL